MFNPKSGKNEWSTINDKGELEFFIGVEAPKYNPEIENYTDYYFSPGQKIKTIAQEMGEDLDYSYKNFASVFNDIGEGVQNGAKVFKYLPFIALAAGGYFILKKTKAI